MGNAALDRVDGGASLDGDFPFVPFVLFVLFVLSSLFSLSCHFLKQVDYFSLVYESKEDSC